MTIQTQAWFLLTCLVIPFIRAVCDTPSIKLCMEDAFAASQDPCTIEDLNHNCLQLSGCDNSLYPPRLCARNPGQAGAAEEIPLSPSSPPLPTDTDFPGASFVNPNELPWLSARSAPASVATLTLALEGSEATFGVGLTQDAESWGAVVVRSVRLGSAAERAGLREGDEVVRLDGLLRTEDTSLGLDFLPLLRARAVVSVAVLRPEQKAQHALPGHDPERLVDELKTNEKPRTESNADAPVTRAGGEKASTFNLCEFSPCYDADTPCFGTRDSFICACPSGSSGRGCNPITLSDHCRTNTTAQDDDIGHAFSPPSSSFLVEAPTAHPFASPAAAKTPPSAAVTSTATATASAAAPAPPRQQQPPPPPPPPTLPLRVALVLSGQPRFLSGPSFGSLQRHVTDPYGADVFFHVWWSGGHVGRPYSVAPWTGLRTQAANSTTNKAAAATAAKATDSTTDSAIENATTDTPAGTEDTPREATSPAAAGGSVSSVCVVEANAVERLVSMYRPVLYEVEAPRTNPGGGHNESPHLHDTSSSSSSYLSRNLADILHSVQRAALLKARHESAHHFTYDFVVKARFDTFLGNLPPLHSLVCPSSPPPPPPTAPAAMSVASNAPPPPCHNHDRLFLSDATRLLLDKPASSSSSRTGRRGSGGDGGLLSVRRGYSTMGREDVLHLSSSHVHDVVAALAGNVSALVSEAGSTHVVQLLRRHLKNNGLLGRVTELPHSIVHGLVRGLESVDNMALYARQ